MNTVEPTLLAMRAATEAVRTANHAAHDAPCTTSSVYDRTGALRDLLAKAVQYAEALGRDTDRLHCAAAASLLGAAERSVVHAAGLVDEAWSELSKLHPEPAGQDETP